MAKNPFLILTAFLCTCCPADAAAADPVKVMTYNIRNSASDRKTENRWDSRKEDLARVIEETAPDVLGLQEVLPEQRKWLEERLPQYVFTGDGRNSDRTSGEASPVAYRRGRFNAVKSGTFWLSETPGEPGSKSWGTKYPRVCTFAVLDDTAGGRRFAFANTHTDHVSELAREKGMLLIIERMKDFSPGSPIVLVGDHNCREHEAPAVAVSKILEEAMYLAETPPAGSWRTFNGWEWRENEFPLAAALAGRKRGSKAPEEWGGRIDYIYVSPGTRVLDYATLAAPRPGTHLYPSDHFPVVATIVFQHGSAGGPAQRKP